MGFYIWLDAIYGYPDRHDRRGGRRFCQIFGRALPSISEDKYLILPKRIFAHYAFSLSSAQLLAIAIIAFLTFTNTRGLRYGKIIQNVFTVAKIGALLSLILAGIFIGRNAIALHVNFGNPGTPVGSHRSLQDLMQAHR